MHTHSSPPAAAPAATAATAAQELSHADNRLMELEIKAAYADDALDHLHAQVYRQQQQIDALIVQVQQMRERLPDASSGPSHPRDEVPPHY